MVIEKRPDECTSTFSVTNPCENFTRVEQISSMDDAKALRPHQISMVLLLLLFAMLPTGLRITSEAFE